jgi:hypothetical protein
VKREVDDQAVGEPTKTVRFASLVTAAGKPEVYLPLFDPKQDRDFMRAVKGNRVLSVRQEPTSTRADYGVVGFDEQKHTTYLVFPKSLGRFANARVIGIQYDVVGSSRTSTGPAAKLTKSNAPAKKSRAPAKGPLKAPTSKPSPPKRLEPQPKTFRVHVRVVSVIDKDVTVKAITKSQAKEKAEAEVQSEGKVQAISAEEIRE